MPNDEDTTAIYRRPYDVLFAARDERDELLLAARVPTGLESVDYVRLLADVFEELVHRAGLERVDQRIVADLATPEALLALASGRVGPGNPLAALAKPSA